MIELEYIQNQSGHEKSPLLLSKTAFLTCCLIDWKPQFSKFCKILSNCFTMSLFNKRKEWLKGTIIQTQPYCFIGHGSTGTFQSFYVWLHQELQ